MRFNEVIVADDDIDDQLMIKKAFAESGFQCHLKFMEDGEHLMDFLTINDGNNCYPNLILLDLNMPRKNGRQALKEIKENANLKSIPVIILTTSKSKEDITQTYELGANCFITKPSTFGDLKKIISKTMEFWIETATLPFTIERI